MKTRLFLTVGLMILLGILSYKPSQIALFNSNPDWQSNWIGLFGARMAYVVFMYFGVAVYIIPFSIL